MSGPIVVYSADEIESLLCKVVRRELLAAKAGVVGASVELPSATPGDRASLPPFATAKEVAAFVQTSVRTLRRLTLAGKFPSPMKVGQRAIRWRRADVEAWADGKERAR